MNYILKQAYMKNCLLVLQIMLLLSCKKAGESSLIHSPHILNSYPVANAGAWLGNAIAEYMKNKIKFLKE
jgi:hypothetical protein